jgi:UDP-N-acetylglucosamine 4,6-dehydratase
MIDLLGLIGRDRELFAHDIAAREGELAAAVREGSFLVIGAAGSVGQAVSKEIFRRDPRLLHLIDISENNLVELVRDLRSSLGYTSGRFQAVPLDCGSPEFDAFVAAQPPYDYILNLSALKHVRSEKDPFTLMRMIQVNVLNGVALLEIAVRQRCRKYFAVSTDKAVRPVNMMGASKSIMEMLLMRAGDEVPVSTARFANVLFSDGSLPFGFTLRFQKQQPISAPRDVFRYFITPQESGELCLMSALLGESRNIFFPKLSAELRLVGFPEIATRYLEGLGYEPYPCASEDEARGRAAELISRRKWPCWFFDSDTTGEKESEEFHTGEDLLELDRFENIGVIRSRRDYDPAALEEFLRSIRNLRESGSWTKQQLVDLAFRVETKFHHRETHRYLDGRM